jgi:hypothetical protein
MTLNQIKTAFATMHDDAESAGFFKKWTMTKGLTCANLVALIAEGYCLRYPGCTVPSKLHRMRKLELVRALAWVIG